MILSKLSSFRPPALAHFTRRTCGTTSNFATRTSSFGASFSYVSASVTKVTSTRSGSEVGSISTGSKSSAGIAVSIETGQFQFRQFLQFEEQIGQLVRIVAALRLLVVEHDVERLLARLIQPHHRHGHFVAPDLPEDGQPRMPADDVAGQFVPDERLDQSELGEALLQLAVRGRRQDPPRVVRGGLER